jgi:hypothetical protein
MALEDIVPDGGYGAFLIWESNGPGRQFGAVAMDLGYGNIYLRQRDEAISKNVTDIPGWASTKETKSVLLGAYRSAIESGECVNRSKEALEETLEYVFGPSQTIVHARSENKSDPSSAKSNHGDRAMADALAWKGMETPVQKITEEEEKPIPVGSLAWRNKQREMDAKKDRDRSGW